MDIRNNYLFGTDIDLSNYGLGKIYQPKYRDFLDNNMEHSDFVKVFYLSEIFNYKYGSEINNIGLIFFLMTIDLENKNESLIESLHTSLELLYKTKNIRFVEHMGAFIINEDIVIDKDNFKHLCTVVLEMTKTNIDYKALDKKNTSDNELLNEFERRKKEYEEKSSKKKNEITFIDIINTVIHYQNNIDYQSILNWTIYQIKNTYEVLMAKEANYITIFRQASMKFDIQEISNWQVSAKLNKSRLGK